MLKNAGAPFHLRVRALVRTWVGWMLLAALWPQGAAAQDASLPGISMLECTSAQKPRANELAQAAAAVRKGSSLTTGLRVRQLEGQILNVNAALLAVKSMEDCQKVAAQIDTIRERLERLAPGASGGPAAAAVPSRAAATTLAPMAPEPAAQLQPFVQAEPAYTQPAQQAPAPIPPQGQAALHGRSALECQASIRREHAALEREVQSMQNSGRLIPADAVAFNRQLADWKTTVNATLLPAQCEQVSWHMSGFRSQLAIAAQATHSQGARAAPRNPAAAQVSATANNTQPATPAAVSVPAPSHVAPAAAVHAPPAPKPSVKPATPAATLAPPSPMKTEGCEKVKDKTKKCPHA